LAVTAVAHKL